jgi:phage N-6-adenine-methyltransferase
MSIMADNTHQSKSNEWYTPQEYTDLVKAVLGEIDLDPASNKHANDVIQAAQYFDQEIDGLNQDWRGKVFLNPPYGRVGGRSGAGVWIEKLINEFQAGNVTEGVVLVNSSTGDKWFQPLFDYPICFVNHRIKFYQPSGDKIQPTKSNVLVYFGTNVKKFKKVFRKIGRIYMPS